MRRPFSLILGFFIGMLFAVPVLIALAQSELLFMFDKSNRTLNLQQTKIVNIGNLGIGTTNPEANLAVIGNRVVFGGNKTIGNYATNDTVLELQNQNENAASYLRLGALNSSLYFAVNDGYKYTGLFAEGNPFIFYIGGKERIRIATSGNIGIGTAAPAYNLHIAPPSGYSRLVVQGVGGAGLATGIHILQGNSAATIGYAGTSNVLVIGNEGTFNTQHLAITPTGKIGIGTTNPLYSLDVNGSLRVNDKVGIGGAPTSDRLKVYGSVNASSVSAGNVTADNLDINTVATIKSLAVENNFTVGGYPMVGAISSGDGSVSIASSTISGVRAYALSVAPGIGVQKHIDPQLCQTTGGIIMGLNEDTTPISSLCYSAEAMKIDNNKKAVYFAQSGTNANVGIGTTAPGAKFEINAVSGESLYIKGSQAEIDARFLSTNGDWQVGTNDNGNGTNNNQFFIYDTAYRFTVQKGTGNVGIGTTAPGYKLEVAGDIYANSGWLRTSGDAGWYSEKWGGGWYMSDSSWIRSYNNKNIYHNSGILRTDGTLQVGDSGATLSVVSGGDFAYKTNVLFANTTGNVGIGTTAPGEKLDVSGTGRFTGIVRSDSSVPFVFMNGDRTGDYNQTAIYAPQNDTSVTNTNGIFIERGRLTNSASAEIRYFTIGARGGQVQWSVDGNGSVIQTGNLTVQGTGDSSIAGNVGIGKTAPGVKLDVNGSIRLSGAIKSTGSAKTYGGIDIWGKKGGYSGINFFDGTGTYESTFMVDVDGATGMYQENIGWQWYWAGDTLTVGTVPWARISDFTGDTSPDSIADDDTISDSEASDTLTINNGLLYAPTSGNVGIGKTDPAVKLDVAGAIRTNSGGYKSDDVGGTGSAAYFPSGMYSTGATNWLYANTTYIGEAPSNGKGHQFNVGANNTVSAYLAIGTGNVGIGTTEPSQKLDVNGTVRAGDYNLCVCVKADAKTVTAGGEKCTGVGDGWSDWSDTANNGNGVEDTRVAIRIFVSDSTCSSFNTNNPV